MQARDRRDGTGAVRVGFTATRRIGGAVARNRAKRRLREAARQTAAPSGAARVRLCVHRPRGAGTRPWPRLLDDMKSALIRLAADLGAGAGGAPH